MAQFFLSRSHAQFIHKLIDFYTRKTFVYLRL